MEKRNLIGLGLIGILVAVKYLVVPVFDWQDEVRESLEQKGRLLSKQQSIVENVEQFTEVKQAYEEQLSAWQTYFFNTEGGTEFPALVAQQIETLTDQHQLTLVRNSWGDVTGDGIKRVDMKLVVKGQFRRAVELIHSIETLDKVFVLESVYFTYNIRKPGEVNLLLTLTAFGTAKDMLND